MAGSMPPTTHADNLGGWACWGTQCEMHNDTCMYARLYDYSVLACACVGLDSVPRRLHVLKHPVLNEAVADDLNAHLTWRDLFMTRYMSL